MLCILEYDFCDVASDVCGVTSQTQALLFRSSDVASRLDILAVQICGTRRLLTPCCCARPQAPKAAIGVANAS